MFIKGKSFLSAFEGEEQEATPETQPKQDPEPEANPQKTFTQEELNGILKKEKEKNRGQLEKALSEVQMLRKKANLTSEEKIQLDKRVEDLQDQLLTKEQRAKNEIEKLQKKAEEERTQLEQERNDWRERFTTTTIERTILDAAHEHNAFDPEQIVLMLKPNTQLAEELSEEGEPTGNLIPKTLFKDTDKEGKAVELKLSVSEAVKRMSEMDRYANLFKYEGQGGFGRQTRPGKGQPTPIDMAKEDPQGYIEKRMKGELEL